MKVIKASIDISTWKIQKDCSDCKSTLEIVCQDVYYDPSGYKKEFYWRVNCCLCNHSIYLLEEELPKLVQVDILKKRYVSSSSGGRD